MFLSEGIVGKVYKIVDIKIDAKLKRRLEILGLTNGTEVEILNKHRNGSAILKVRGTRFAVSKKIAKGIEVIKDEQTSECSVYR